MRADGCREHLGRPRLEEREWGGIAESPHGNAAFLAVKDEGGDTLAAGGGLRSLTAAGAALALFGQSRPRQIRGIQS
jgi:hypothetical protein